MSDAVPLFEFVCNECSKKFTFLTGVVAESTEPACPRCSSQDLRKLISRVARGRSDDERMDALADRMDTQDLDDEATVRRFAREMGREIGAETGEDIGDEMEAMIDAEAHGEDGEYGGTSYGAGGDDGTIY